MIKNYSDCNKCMHKEVCQYKTQFEEAFEKIKTRWDNIASPDFFLLDLDCRQYRLEKESEKGFKI